MKRHFTFLLCSFLLIFSISCSSKVGNVDYSNEGMNKKIKEIRDGKLNETTVINDSKTSIKTVSEDESSSHITNEKFELNIDSEFSGNPYDTKDINMYGEFVSPSNKLYTMPAFYYVDYERSFIPLDEDALYPMKGYVEQGGVSINGVIDEINGKKVPVAKATFDSIGGEICNVGAILNTDGVNNRQNSVSIWLKKSDNLIAEKLYLGFYQSKGEAYIELTDLSTDWKKYTFNYSDFTPNNTDGSTELLNMDSMYSGYISTRGGVVSGDLYISELAFYRDGFEGNKAVLSDFIAEDLRTFKSDEINGKEKLTKTEKENFKLRFRFEEEGAWIYRITTEVNGKKTSTYSSSVNVSKNTDKEKNKGLIRVEPTLKRNFIFEDGTPFVAHGQNIAYSVDKNRGSYDYDVFFPKMKEAGMNFCRVWLTYIGYGVENTEGGILGFSNNQNRAKIFDCILDMAEENNFYLQVPLMTFSRFHSESVTDDVEWRSWDSSPYNKINGGYLDKANEFYSDARAINDTQELYRYYVARYGYSRNILNWEIMNEIGESSDYDQTVAKNWAEKIGDYMHSIDPFNHLVSLSSVKFFDEVYSANSLDFTSIHSYIWNAQYAVNASEVTKEVWKKFNKPVIIGEIGASSVSEDYNLIADPEGLVMRQTAFTAPMSGSAGGGMLWWWQQINNQNFYKNITPAIEYFKNLPSDFVKMSNIETDDYKIENCSSIVKPNIKVLGFKDKEEIYAYMFDTRYSYANTDPGTINNISVRFNLNNGKYKVKIFDTQKGIVLETKDIEAKNNTLNIQIDSFNKDIAFIINK